MACAHCSDERRGRIARVIERHLSTPGSLIPMLQDLQRLDGFLAEDALRQAAEAMRVPLSRLYGIATFYSQFHLAPPGKTIVKVCQGTACHVNGADAITSNLLDAAGLAAAGTTADGGVTIETVACLGCCGLAPVITVDDRVIGPVTPKTARRAMKAAMREAAKSEEAS